MALTITLKASQPHRQRYLVSNATGGATSDILTQTTMAANATSTAVPMSEFMVAAYASSAAWLAAAFEGNRLRVTITARDSSAHWGVVNGYVGATGNITIFSNQTVPPSPAAAATAYLDIEFDYVDHRWPRNAG